jgi:hypothetical protein
MRGDFGSGIRQNGVKEWRQELRQSSLGYPPEAEACQRDSKLSGGDISVELIESAQESLRSLVAFGGQRLDPRPSDAYESEFRRDEKTVGHNERHHSGQLEENG